jgi:hypothetical protein
VGKRNCDRENDVLRAVGNGLIDEDVRSHVAECASCADLLHVASAVVDDRRTLMGRARVPSSGLVWWRANLRARQQATRVAVRAATFVQVALVVLAIGIAVVLAGAKLDYRAFLNASVASLSQWAVPLIAFGAWLILAPVAVYFAVTED